jgi:hypothetical protein
VWQVVLESLALRESLRRVRQVDHLPAALALLRE